MPALARPLLLALALALGVGCAPAQQEEAVEPDAAARAEDPGEVVAVLDGEAIHRRDLDEWIRDHLYEEALRGKDEAERHQYLSEQLERMVVLRLVEVEAGKRGVTPQALFDQVTAGIEPTDEEVRSFYETNQARLPDEASFEQLAPRIREHLVQQGRVQAWRRFVSGLEDGADLQVELKPPRVEVAAVGPARGPEDAPVTIVEFSDFNCPFCKRVKPTLDEILARYPEQVRLVYRNFPLQNVHPRARATAEAAVCAGEQDEFWAFHDRAFAAEAMSDQALLDTAESLGLDMEAFRACLADGRAGEVVERDLQAARALGIDSTPSFFINGIRLSGAQEVDAFVRVIEQELEAAGEETAAGKPAASS